MAYLRHKRQRKLRGVWTVEQCRDLAVEYGLDLEEDLAIALRANIANSPYVLESGLEVRFSDLYEMTDANVLNHIYAIRTIT